MPVKNPTQWAPPSGRGYITSSSDVALKTQSGVDLLTQDGETITINPTIYQPEFATSWSATTRNRTGWVPKSGTGYVINAGTQYLVTNAGDFLVTNDGDYLVTTPTYDVPKYATQWTATGV